MSNREGNKEKKIELLKKRENLHKQVVITLCDMFNAHVTAGISSKLGYKIGHGKLAVSGLISSYMILSQMY